MHRPDPTTLTSENTPQSARRILDASQKAESIWIGPKEAVNLSDEEKKAYDAAHTIICHMAIEMPRAHSSGHPGGPLSAFTMAYWVTKLRDSSKDQPLRMSPGHLSILGFTLQWLFGRGGDNPHLQSLDAIIKAFRTPDGLPGHIEAGIGDIPFGTGPLGKGVSNALGVAFGLKYIKKEGKVDVILADGDAQEGQVMEAFRLAAALKTDNLVVHGDWNDIQLSEIASDVMASDFAAIATAAGWQVIEVQDGNDPAQVKAAIEKSDTYIGKGRPIFICYYTTMGHGIELMEKGSDSGEKIYHGAPLNDEEAKEAIESIPAFDDAIAVYEKYRNDEKRKYEEMEKVVTDIPLVFDPKNLNGYERTITTEKGAARKDFGATHILNMMKADERIIVLHADLAGSGGFNKVEKELPDRCINVGVAEANMLMMAAGMRQVGLLPVTYTFAAFITNEARANARLIDINCGHTRCGIINDGTHTGLSVGEDGETHQERHYLDIPFDHTQVWMPADSNQAAAMAECAMQIIAEGHESVYIFSPRSGHPQLLKEDGSPVYGMNYVFDSRATMLAGKGTTEDDVTIIATGITVHEAMKAVELLCPCHPELAEGHKDNNHDPFSVRILNISSVRPLDASAIIQAALETGHLIVVEDHSSESGLAHQVADVIADFQLPCSLRRLGVNHYFPSGKANELMMMAGLDAESIADTVRDEVKTEICGGEDMLVSCLYTFAHNRLRSRFGGAVSSRGRARDDQTIDFAKKLKEKDYIDTLRSYWSGTECPKEELPSNEDLLGKL